MGSKVFGIVTLVFMGAILADILTHPAGTTAAGNSLAGLLKPSLNAVLGYKV